MAGPLAGTRVVDMSRYLSGPTVAMLLGALGADVVKVEGAAGDPSRETGPFDHGESVYFMAANHNKRSLALDFRAPGAVDIVRRLIAQADVFVQNFRPGVAEAMGLGWETLHSLNPRLVYCSISGFGAGPVGGEIPGFDQTAQAMSGLMSITGEPDGPPLRVGTPVADTTTGLYGVIATLAALLGREESGEGQLVELSLMQSMAHSLTYQAQRYLSLGDSPTRNGNDHPILFPQGTFATADGSLSLASGNGAMWRALCGAIGMPELATDPMYATNADRMAHRAELRVVLERRFGEDTTEAWTARIRAVGVPCGPVRSVQEALEHPVSRELGLVEEVLHPSIGVLRILGRPFDIGSINDAQRPAPTLGQHSGEICAELGLSPDEIDEYVAAGVVVRREAMDHRTTDGARAHV